MMCLPHYCRYTCHFATTKSLPGKYLVITQLHDYHSHDNSKNAVVINGWPLKYDSSINSQYKRIVIDNLVLKFVSKEECAIIITYYDVSLYRKHGDCTLIGLMSMQNCNRNLIGWIIHQQWHIFMFV